MKEQLTALIAQAKTFFAARSPRERALFILIGLAVLVAFYSTRVYKPLEVSRLAKFRNCRDLEKQVKAFKSELPPIEDEMAKETSLDKKQKEFSQIIASVHKSMPRQNSMPVLLRYLVKCADGYDVEILNVVPKIEDKEVLGYQQMKVDVELVASYQDMINYMNRVEKISQHLRITELTLENMKSEGLEEVHATLSLRTLIMKAEREADPDVFLNEQTHPVIIQRNPFVSPAKQEVDDKSIVLNGIIATGKMPTAIINNSVYRVGDFVGTYQVKQILPDRVLLRSASRELVLTMRKEQ